MAVGVGLWVDELHANLERTLKNTHKKKLFFLKMMIKRRPRSVFSLRRLAYLGNHGDAPQLLGDQALHDPLEGLLHLDDVVLVERDALLPERDELDVKNLAAPPERAATFGKKRGLTSAPSSREANTSAAGFESTGQ